MFGLSSEEWKNLALSVNIRKKERLLSPIQTATHMKKALKATNIETLSERLGFQETSTLRKILRLKDLSSEIASLVDWGNRKGLLSMSTASELMRLPKTEMTHEAMKAAVIQSITRDEARQIVQIQQRSDYPIEECIKQTLKTRPLIERQELILGSFQDPGVIKRCELYGNEPITKKLKIALASKFPDVIFESVRINGSDYSILLKDDEAQNLRAHIGNESIGVSMSEIINRLNFDVGKLDGSD